MPDITFYNQGNADSCRIKLDAGQQILFDFGNQHNPDNEDDLRCNLADELRCELMEAGRDYFDVVAFTHLDKDHYQGASEFFYLEHADKYQSKDRIQMNSMWVPAAVIIETGVDDAEGRIIQKEARYRLREGKNIRVFSRPGLLDQWLKENGLKLEDRKDLITDAGQLAPEFRLDKHGAEFFVHSPFAKRRDEGEIVDRNSESIVMQVTFDVRGTRTRLFLGSDVKADVLADIVNVTEKHDRRERLEWDIHKLPHHCSVHSLRDEERDPDADKVEPIPEVARLFETYAQDGAIVVSSSETIPRKGDKRDKQKGANPPHRQASNYYREHVADARDGEFKVTMEHPTPDKPVPLAIHIDAYKASIRKSQLTGAAATLSVRAPRAG